MSDQYLRKATLFLRKDNRVLDLSQMQLQFRTSAADQQSPNSAFIRILNLSQKTAELIRTEFTRVLLQAGYQTGNFGAIFDGQILEVRKGRINPTDTFVDIFASDNDLAYNFGYVSGNLAAGSTQKNAIDAAVKGFNDTANPALGIGGISNSDTVSYGPGPGINVGGVLPRGKTMFGMARDTMRTIARTNQFSWSLNGNTLAVTPFTGYRPGEVVEISSKTGMIGIPEQTNNGIIVRTLLNPRFQIAGRVHINNKDILPAAPDLQVGALNNFAAISADGFYKILVAEHRGDTRGPEWLTELTCLTTDASLPASNAIKPFEG
jgi:hypothetical protein